MSRAIMHAELTAAQHAAEADLERLSVEQQRAILAPRPVKVYTFRRNPFNRNDIYVVVSVPAGPMPVSYTTTDATYDRFVALANSGNYRVTILDSDYGIAWSLRRN